MALDTAPECIAAVNAAAASLAGASLWSLSDGDVLDNVRDLETDRVGCTTAPCGWLPSWRIAAARRPSARPGRAGPSSTAGGRRAGSRRPAPSGVCDDAAVDTAGRRPDRSGQPRPALCPPPSQRPCARLDRRRAQRPGGVQGTAVGRSAAATSRQRCTSSARAARAGWRACGRGKTLVRPSSPARA